MKTLEDLVKELPPQLHQEVLDFVEFLLVKHRARSGRKIQQGWAGALREYRDRYTSVALQKKASDWRNE